MDSGACCPTTYTNPTTIVRLNQVNPVFVSRCQIEDLAEFYILIKIGYVETSTSFFINVCIY
jgi:hypothetical protein